MTLVLARSEPSHAEPLAEDAGGARSPPRRRLLHDNLALVAQYGVAGLVPLVLVPHIVHAIGLSAFGDLAVALAWSNYGAVVVQYAFPLEGPRQIAHLRSDETPFDVVCRIGSAKAALLAIIAIVALAATLTAWAGGWRVSAAQALLLLALPAAAALHTGWFLQAMGRFGIASALSISGAAVAVIFGLGLVRGPSADDILFAAMALSIGPLWNGLGTLAAALHLVERPPVAPRKRLWRSPGPELRGGWPLFASQFAAALYAASGPIVIGLLAGAQEAGAYATVERASTAVAGACMLTHIAAYPRLARLYSQHRAEYLQLLRRVLLAYASTSGGVILAVVLAWPQVLAFLLGVGGASHGALLASSLAWMAIAIFGTALTGYLTVRGEGHLVLPLTLRVLALSLTLGIPAVLGFGAAGWLTALCLSQSLVVVAGWRAWQREHRARTASTDA